MRKSNEAATAQKGRKPYTILTDTIARSITPDDKVLPDRTVRGLEIRPTSRKGRGYWYLVYTSPVTKKRPELPLGIYPDVPIAEAREKATEARKLIAKGIDPKMERDAKKAALEQENAVLTFEAAARTCIDQKKGGWRNAKHIGQWLRTLETYVFPHIGNRKVDSLIPEDFRKVLSPIWLTKAETASRVKQRCQKVMQWCWAHGHVQNNVVSVVSELLPDAKEARRPEHFPAMPWQKVPEFVCTVVRKDRMGTSRALMEWVILTAARSGESRNLTWEQIDLENAVWNIPPDNTKMNRLHHVPLSNRCMEILEEQKAYFRLMHGKDPASTDLVFPSPRGKVYSDMTLSKFMKDHKAISDTAGRNAVPHGFRTSFRGWATINEYPEHLIELCLAHIEESKSVAAYKREQLLELRRPIMQAYAEYVASHNATVQES